jgi:hypothetical protein
VEQRNKKELRHGILQNPDFQITTRFMLLEQ